MGQPMELLLGAQLQGDEGPMDISPSHWGSGPMWDKLVSIIHSLTFYYAAAKSLQITCHLLSIYSPSAFFSTHGLSNFLFPI